MWYCCNLFLSAGPIAESRDSIKILFASPTFRIPLCLTLLYFYFSNQWPTIWNISQFSPLSPFGENLEAEKLAETTESHKITWLWVILGYISLHCVTRGQIPLHCVTLGYISGNFGTLDYISLHFALFCFAPLRSAAPAAVDQLIVKLCEG